MRDKKIKNEAIIHKPNEKAQAAIFLSMAVAAILSLVILLYLKISDTGADQSLNGSEVTQVLNMEEKASAAIQEKLPMPRNEMVVPNDDAIQGKWFTTFGDHGVIEIWFGGGKYELVSTTDPQGRYRRYSKGNYRLREKDGQVSLFPSSAEGAPKKIAGVAYQSMSMRNYDIYLKINPGAGELYFMAPEYQVRTKSFHPIFLFSDYTGAPVLKFSPVQVGE